MNVFERTLAGDEVRALFAAPAIVQRMLDFEAALAQAQADCGLLPAAAAAAIVQACRADAHDVEAIVAAGRHAGSLAIPLVKSLRRAAGAAADHVHRGSTSQDVIDSALALATRDALRCVDAQLENLVTALHGLTARHLATPVLARTLLQPALVTSFGLKCMNWAAPLQRSRERLNEVAARALALQLGGAAGTLSGMAGQGAAVAARLAPALGLALPPSPWHTQRDEWVRLGMEAAVCGGSLAKLATDLALLGQAEVGEIAEAPAAGRGGSSAMPHKRNPVAAMVALAATERVPAHAATLLATMAQQHERGLGRWQAELATWPQLWVDLHAAAQALAGAFGALQVDAARMRRNIDALGGLVFAEAAAHALAPHLGQARAQDLLERCSREAADAGRPLATVLQAALRADAALEPLADDAALAAAFDPLAAAQPAAAMAQALLDRIGR